MAEFFSPGFFVPENNGTIVIPPYGIENPTQIAVNSPLLHSDRFYGDVFDYPDTTSWKTAFNTDPAVVRASGLGEPSSIINAVIDSTVQANSHSTLKLPTTERIFIAPPHARSSDLHTCAAYFPLCNFRRHEF